MTFIGKKNTTKNQLGFFMILHSRTIVEKKTMAKQAPKLIYSLRVTKKKSYKRHSESSSNLVRELFCGEIVKKVHILPFKINHSFEQVLKKSKPT